MRAIALRPSLKAGQCPIQASRLAYRMPDIGGGSQHLTPHTLPGMPSGTFRAMTSWAGCSRAIPLPALAADGESEAPGAAEVAASCLGAEDCATSGCVCWALTGAAAQTTEIANIAVAGRSKALRDSIVQPPEFTLHHL
jgi:hypothetical protein